MSGRFRLACAILFVLLPTGAGAATIETHGDPPTVADAQERLIAADSTFGPTTSGRAAYSLSSGWCGGSRRTDDPTDSAGATAPQFKLVYAYAADAPNRIDQYGPVIQRYVRFASQTVSTASNGRWGLRFDTGLACDPGAVDILTVPLSGPSSKYLGSDRFTQVRSEVMSNPEVMRIATLGPRDFIIFADGLGQDYGAAGEGQVYNDDRPGQDNAHAKGGLTALIWGKGGNDFFGDVTPGSAAEVMLHELTHNLGAVQLSSAHSSGRLHCSDEVDVMCYNDGTPTFTRCPQDVSAYDCGSDDYFNPTGNIVGATGARAGQPIWNIATSPFLCPQTACASTLSAPQVRLTASTTTPARGELVSLTADWADADGYVKEFAWDRDGDGQYDYVNPSVGQIGISVSRSTTVTVRVTDSDGLQSTASVTISPPASPPVAVLSAPAKAAANSAFQISAAGSSGAESYTYDLDGDGQYEYPAGNALSVSYPTAGPRTIGVRVVGANGAAAVAQRTITITAPASSSGGGSSGVPPTSITLKATLSKQAIADAIRRGVPAKLTASAAVSLTVTVKDAKTKKLYGTRTVRVQKGTTTARVALTSTARRALRKKQRVVVSIQGASSAPVVVSASVKSSLVKSR